MSDEIVCSAIYHDLNDIIRSDNAKKERRWPSLLGEISAKNLTNKTKIG